MTEIWFIAAGVLILAELLVTTFFMLPFAIGAFFAGIVSLITDSQDIQLGTFVVFSIVGVYISVKIFGPRKQKKEEEAINDYVNDLKTQDEINKELDNLNLSNNEKMENDWNS